MDFNPKKGPHARTDSVDIRHLAEIGETICKLLRTLVGPGEIVKPGLRYLQISDRCSSLEASLPAVELEGLSHSAFSPQKVEAQHAVILERSIFISMVLTNHGGSLNCPQSIWRFH
jgi:hypothetical protein